MRPFAISDLHIPQAHYLESWGDARTSDNTLVPVQPLIAPLFGGLTELEVLARVGGLEVTRPHEIVRETFSKVSGGDLLEEKWKKFLHDGYLEGSGAKFITTRIFRPTKRPLCSTTHRRCQLHPRTRSKLF